MQNKVTTIEKVIAEHCFTGMSVLLPGFVNVGVAESLIDGLLETDITDLQVISNNTSVPGRGIGKLVRADRIRKITCSHIGNNSVTVQKVVDGEINLTFVPQGSLCEKVRAGGAGIGDNPISESSSPSIGAYGWHHIGVLVHQEATGSGSSVNYSGWSELYVDGVKVWKVKSNMSALTDAGLSLFTASSSNSKLTFSDTNPSVRFRFDRFASSGDPAYALVGNVKWRMVDVDFDPTTEIEPVVSPAAVDYVIPGTSVHVNGAVYFKAAD